MARKLSERAAKELGLPRRPWKTFDLPEDAGDTWLEYHATLRSLGDPIDCVSRWATKDGERVLRVSVGASDVRWFRECVKADEGLPASVKRVIVAKIGGAP